jgi:PLD-like domain/Translation initiation factor IF-2, N-terminal region
MTEVNVLWTPAWHRKLYDLIKSAKHEILLVSPWLKMSGAELILNAVLDNSNGAPKINLLTTLEERDLIGKTSISDIEAYILLHGNEVSVRVVRGLHAKIYLVDDSEAIVTSGNLTSRGLGRAYNSNLEIALHLTSPDIVSKIKAGLLPVWEKSEPLTSKKLKSMAVRISELPSIEESSIIDITQSEEDAIASLAFGAPRWQAPNSSKDTDALTVSKSGKDLLALFEGDAELLEALDIIKNINLRTLKTNTPLYRIHGGSEEVKSVEIATARILDVGTTIELVTQNLDPEIVIPSTLAIPNDEVIEPKKKEKAPVKKPSTLQDSSRSKIAPETLFLFASGKKVTVRTLATEINISHNTLIDFLQKKGFKSVKSVMSKVRPEAIELVLKKFGKEKAVSEKRQKKVAAFKEKRAKTQEDFLAKHPEQRKQEGDFVENPNQPRSRPKKKSAKRKLTSSVKKLTPKQIKRLRTR